MKKLIILSLLFSSQAMEYISPENKSDDHFKTLEELSNNLSTNENEYAQLQEALNNFAPGTVQRIVELGAIGLLLVGTTQLADDQRKRIPLTDSTGLLLLIGSSATWLLTKGYSKFEHFVLDGALDKVEKRLIKVEEEFKNLQSDFEQVYQRQEEISGKVHQADEKLGTLITAVHARLQALHQQFPQLPEPKKLAAKKPRRWWSKK